MRIIFTGSGEFGLPTLREILHAGHEIVTVYTQPDRPAGRGRKLSPTPIGAFALEHSIPLVRTADLNAENLPPADLMIVIAFGQKIAPAAVNHARFSSVNLHASRLPKFRGAAPINWAILSGETVTGNSVIRLATKMDAGNILAQSQFPIGPTETAGELHDRLATDGAPLVLSVIRDLESGSAKEIAQDESMATLAPKLSRLSTHINWQNSADQIDQQIRGMYPWPGCHVRILDAGGQEKCRVTLVRAAACEGEGCRWNPGEITLPGDICVGDGNHSIRVLELQPEGKRPMPLADFQRGHPWMAGMKLESLA